MNFHRPHNFIQPITTAGYSNNWLTLNLRILNKIKMLKSRHFKLKWPWWTFINTKFAKKTKLTSSFDPNKPVQTGFVPRSQNRRICTIEIIPYSSTCSKLLLHHCQKTKNKLCSFKWYLWRFLLFCNFDFLRGRLNITSVFLANNENSWLVFFDSFESPNFLKDSASLL